ncbi:trypsin-like peptidase domain-containing protein [Streptomyces pseudogriseolus]|uniref:trypsin-like peptidase domain-containing protein n=1 Tax=Streptomyces pseudogriseolus TaxID=36817 RepID=UPI003FA2F3AA
MPSLDPSAHALECFRPTTHPALPAPTARSAPAPARLPESTADPGLIALRDLAGRPRGTGFVADRQGTVITSHEAVDALPRLVLHGAEGRHSIVTADAVTPLPALGLALVRGGDLGVAPLPVTSRDTVATGAYVRIPAGGWREARILGTATVTYTATDRAHQVPGALELAVGTAGRDALRLGGGAAGGPVLDPATGTVVGVLGTALRTAASDVGFAVPLRPTVPALAALLMENAATVPAYGTDLNLAGLVGLTTASVARHGPRQTMEPVEPVERTGPRAELYAFERGEAPVLGLVGPPGSGRSTELAALAARRHREGLPTLWLRGADLREDDASVADAARRALERAAADVTACLPFPPQDPGDLAPERHAALAGTAGRPLLLLLDDPEQAPPGLHRRRAAWTEETARWLRATGTRLVVSCGAEHWEETGRPYALQHPAGTGPDGLPPCVALGDLTADEAREARARYGIPEGAVTDADAAHPLTLRLLAEVRSDVAAAPPDGPVDRDDVFAAHLDLTCLRIAQRLAGGLGARGTAVRRLAARAAGKAHEAARRCLGTEDGALVRASFEELFPASGPGTTADGPGGTASGGSAVGWADAVSDGVGGAASGGWGVGWADAAPEGVGGAAPSGTASGWADAVPEGPGGTAPGAAAPGWADAVLAEGLLVPAGDGYRFGHEELADWLQGAHLDLDGALHTLVHAPAAGTESDTRTDTDTDPVPRHRVGPVVEALLCLARRHGPARLASRLADLTHALDADPGSWWASRLLTGALTRVPDAGPYTDVLRLLADRVVAWREQRRTVPPELGPTFWTRLRLPVEARCALLRRLVLADGPPCESGPRFLDAVAGLLTADPATVLPYLIRWFDDERPLPATPHATVATAAQALLHTHRHAAPDALTEALADSPHRRADELLAVLAEEEPGALCRAVDRWAEDPRPARRAAAVTHGLRVAPYARDLGDRTLLRYAALAVLVRTADRALHGGALALLVRDPDSRGRHLARALERFAAGDPHFPPDALTDALTTHPEPVLDAFRTRLTQGTDPDDTFRALADATTPALARPVAALVRDAAALRPELTGCVAGYADRRLEYGPAARAVLRLLLTELLDGGPRPLRSALAGVLAAPGTSASRPLRRGLLDTLLAQETDPGVLDAVLCAAARTTGPELRVLVHRTALLLVRTPEGAVRLDRTLTELARRVPGLAAAVAGWLADAPHVWGPLVGPATREVIDELTGAAVPV